MPPFVTAQAFIHVIWHKHCSRRTYCPYLSIHKTKSLRTTCFFLKEIVVDHPTQNFPWQDSGTRKATQLEPGGHILARKPALWVLQESLVPKVCPNHPAISQWKTGVFDQRALKTCAKTNAQNGHVTMCIYIYYIIYILYIYYIYIIYYILYIYIIYIYITYYVTLVYVIEKCIHAHAYAGVNVQHDIYIYSVHVYPCIHTHLCLRLAFFVYMSMHRYDTAMTCRNRQGTMTTRSPFSIRSRRSRVESKGATFSEPAFVAKSSAARLASS